MRIGNTYLRHGLILAPMAGYTDRGMRMVAAECGAEYAVTEMVSAKAVVFGDKKTYTLARIMPDECPTALQIFGSEPDIMAKGANMLLEDAEKHGYMMPAAIDINMGCPVNKIFKNGEGSALMRDPELIYNIVRSVAVAVDIPVTVKLRRGIDAEHINAVECALAAQEGGAMAVAVHGRTRSQLYGGASDPNIIKAVKDALKIPVIANGDITDKKSAATLLEKTGADGIMVGRAAVGNPFIFKEIIAALEGKIYTPPTLDEKKHMAIRQLRLSVSDRGEAVAIPEARKQIASYFKGFYGSAQLRAKINSMTKLDEVERAILEIKN